MSLAQKHGFRFQEVPKESVVVSIFRQKWLNEHGYPLDLPCFATNWIAVTKGEGKEQGVYCVFGWRVVIPHAIEITDLYPYAGRTGVLATRAALERIRSDADRTGMDVVGGTPPWNTPMIAALKRGFDLKEPDILTFRYIPNRVAATGTA